MQTKSERVIEATAARVGIALSDQPDVIERKMMGGVCFMVKGRMCCSVSRQGGLLIRVGEGARASMLGEPHVQPVEMAGRTMTGFVRIAPDGYRSDAALRTWLKRGLDFVATLPPNSSRRKRRGKPPGAGAPARRK